MSSINPGRTGLRLAMALVMLLTLVGAGTASASVVGPAAAPATAAHDFGSGSCVGILACYGATGAIGDNSCIGDYACYGATGAIGDNSCNEYAACDGATGAIGDNSCNEYAACDGAAGAIGDNSCNGDSACYGATSSVGDCMYNVVTPEACLLLDARIKKLHVHNAWIGGGIRNTTAEGQARGRYVAGPTTVRFGIRIQNTGDTADSFSLSISDPDAPECLAFCAAFDADTPGFHVRYRHAHHSITDAVVGGTFVTPVLAPGEWYQFRAKVRVTSGAVPGSRIRRLATFTSVNDGTSQDAVKFVVTAKGMAPTLVLNPELITIIPDVAYNWGSAHGSGLQFGAGVTLCADTGGCHDSGLAILPDGTFDYPSSSGGIFSCYTTDTNYYLTSLDAGGHVINSAIVNAPCADGLPN